MNLRAEVSDEALMARYQRGDRAAFTVIVRRHQGPLFNFAFRLVRIQGTAEEVVQDTFVRVVQSASDFKHDSRFTTYIYTIARNLCIDQLRKRSLRQHPSLDAPIQRGDDSETDGSTMGEQTADGRADVHREATTTELKERISQAVDELPDEQREVFLMREVANLPFDEIAKISGVSTNTIKSRMRYALERLQQALVAYEEYARALTLK